MDGFQADAFQSDAFQLTAVVAAAPSGGHPFPRYRQPAPEPAPPDAPVFASDDDDLLVALI